MSYKEYTLIDFILTTFVVILLALIVLHLPEAVDKTIEYESHNIAKEKLIKDITELNKFYSKNIF